MKSYQFDLNEGNTTATLTVKASDEQSAIQQARDLVKSSGSIGSPRQLNEPTQRVTS